MFGFWRLICQVKTWCWTLFWHKTFWHQEPEGAQDSAWPWPKRWSNQEQTKLLPVPADVLSHLCILDAQQQLKVLQMLLCLVSSLSKSDPSEGREHGLKTDLRHQEEDVFLHGFNNNGKLTEGVSRGDSAERRRRRSSSWKNTSFLTPSYQMSWRWIHKREHCYHPHIVKDCQCRIYNLYLHLSLPKSRLAAGWGSDIMDRGKEMSQ